MGQGDGSQPIEMQPGDGGGVWRRKMQPVFGPSTSGPRPLSPTRPQATSSQAVASLAAATTSSATSTVGNEPSQKGSMEVADGIPAIQSSGPAATEVADAPSTSLQRLCTLGSVVSGEMAVDPVPQTILLSGKLGCAQTMPSVTSESSGIA